MSVLDLDYYKLTMLQFIWKHYADMPVTFRLHSRKQDLGSIVNPVDLQRRLDHYVSRGINQFELEYLEGLGCFEPGFIEALRQLFNDSDLAHPHIGPHGDVVVSDTWLYASLWETVVLSAVSEQYSLRNVLEPDNFKRFADIYRIGQSGAKWADFGTRRRWSVGDHEFLVANLHHQGAKYGFTGTSNVAMALGYGLKPIGTYAHELEMVLRPYFGTERATTRDVLTKWQAMYPRELRVALTDTYTTSYFLEQHGRFLLDNDWRGVRLDSGEPHRVGYMVEDFLIEHGAEMDVVFSDGLDADTIISLQDDFGRCEVINPSFGWGTGLTNQNSDLSLVMKAVESRGQPTYKTTDDPSKSIRS